MSKFYGFTHTPLLFGECGDWGLGTGDWGLGTGDWVDEADEEDKGT
ncbi:hypothetical protein NIES2107_00210 [Nostoc carneum NIES-2107]|nr:hypothetical protein NIES2107_00210 [Nostoc carneum NIES-2107]